MSITVNDPAEDHLPDEKSVVIADGALVEPDSIILHPYDRPEYADPRGVYIAVGWLDERGEPVIDAHGDTERMQNVIVNRDDFVEAVLAVFPELTRA